MYRDCLDFFLPPTGPAKEKRSSLHRPHNILDLFNYFRAVTPLLAVQRGKDVVHGGHKEIANARAASGTATTLFEIVNDLDLNWTNSPTGTRGR